MSKVNIITDDNKTTLKAQSLAAIARLSQIENSATMTNAQVFAALKDMAKILRLLLRFIGRNI